MEKAMKVMLVHGQFGQGGEESRLARALGQCLASNNFAVSTAQDAEEAMILMDANLGAAIVDWNLDVTPNHLAARTVLDNLRQARNDIPVFLFVKKGSSDGIPSDILSRVDGFAWLGEETIDDIANDLMAALRRYAAPLLPAPFKTQNASLKSGDGWNYFDFFGQKLGYDEKPARTSTILAENAEIRKSKSV